MIIQCEQCATRFKVADDKVTGQGIKVRCSKCQHVFRATADSAAPVPSGGVSRPSGIFAAPETVSPLTARSSSSGSPSSGSVNVPQASLAAQDPTFDPFAAPTSDGSPSNGAAAPAQNGGAISFELEDLPPGASDRSLFGPANHTIGGFDEDDVPAPPPPPPADSLEQEPPPPPPLAAASSSGKAAGGDPFANPLHGGQGEDPFATQPPQAANGGAHGGHFADPFGVATGPSAPAAFPTAGDPFAAAANAHSFPSNDPFGGAPPFGQASAAASTPPGADPFAAQATLPQAAPMAPPSSSPGGDPFAGLGVEVADPYAPTADEPPAPPPNVAPSAPPSVPPPAAQKAAVTAPKKPARASKALRIPPAVPRVAWAALQACILVAFLTISIVWVRGGSLDDIAQGRSLDVVLGRAAVRGDSGAPVRVDDVVVARRPVDVASDLVVVSGFVLNGGSADAPAARVTVRFGDATSEAAWANAGVDGVDLTTAGSVESLLALNDRVPKSATVAAGARVPFVVLARGVPDGAKADVAVEIAEAPPPPAAPPEVAPVAEEDPATRKGKKLRRKPTKAGDEGAAARPRVKRAGAAG